MNVPNLNKETLQEILPRVQKQFPGAHISKELFGIGLIHVPYENCFFQVDMDRINKAHFKTDIRQPLTWRLVGLLVTVIIALFARPLLLERLTMEERYIIISRNALIILGFLMVKIIFKFMNKRKIKQFNKSFIDVVNGIGNE